MTLADYILFGRKAYDLFKDCIILLDLNLKIHYANRSASLAFKDNIEELLERNVDYVSKELKHAIVSYPIQDLDKLRKLTRTNIAFTDKHENIFRVATSILTLENQNEIVGFMIVFNYPLTAEDNTPKFNQRTSLINALNIRSDEFCYIADLASGRNVFVSKSSERFVGWKVEDLMSAAFAISKQHPDDVWMITEFYKKVQRWFKFPGKYDHLPVHFKYRMMHKNGYYVHLKITIMLLERDENNIPKYTICFGKTYQPKKEVAINNNSALTTRETEVLQLLANGKSYKMIATDLGISIDSVRTYIRRIYQKLHVHSVTEAVHKAIY